MNLPEEIKYLPKGLADRCELFSDQFDILALMLRDAYLADAKASRSVSALRKYFKANAKDLDEVHTSFIADQHIMSVTLGDPKPLARLLSKEGGTLDPDSVEVLTYWRDHPAFFLFFSIIGSLGGDVYVVQDLFTDQTHYVHSRSLGVLQMRQETRGKHYLTLMYDNGLCLQTAGLLHYSDLDVSSMTFLLESLDRERFAHGGIDQVLKAHPTGLHYYRLLANAYAMSSHGELLMICYSQFDSLDYSFDEQYWEVEKKGRLRKYTLVEASPAMYAAVGDDDLLDHYCNYQSIMVFQLEHHWVVLSTSVGAFFVSSKVLALKESEAEHLLDPIMVVTAERDRLTTPWFPFTLSGENQEPIEESEEMNRINEMMAHYIKETNQGHVFDLEGEAKRFGVDLEKAQMVVEQFKESLKRHFWTVPEEEKQYEIAQCPVPAPIKRSDFGDSPFIIEHLKFAFSNIKALDELGDVIGVPEISLSEIIVSLEKAFTTEVGDEGGGTLSLNTLLWIVLSSEDKPILVRSLALEIYKLYPVFAQNIRFESYVEAFSRVVLRRFVALQLFTLQQRPSTEERNRGLYTIRATALLRALVKTVEKTGEKKPIVRIMG
ncbi:MAG: hypothetical protein M0Q37_04245 [Sphaerochaeta sp.]|nr:hypothetical protein [Sphaerochaeta sp.]